MTSRPMTRLTTRHPSQGQAFCERGTLYTLGYVQPRAAARLDQLMRAEQVLLVDVRLKPYSRWHQHWDLAALAACYGTRYCWEART